MCKIPYCRDYKGKGSSGLCTWHQSRIDIKNIQKEEEMKLHGTAKPIHNKIIKEVRY